VQASGGTPEVQLLGNRHKAAQLPDIHVAKNDKPRFSFENELVVAIRPAPWLSDGRGSRERRSHDHKR
jgi:hypothetical protein